MKKIIALLVSLLMIVSVLGACSSGNNDASGGTESPGKTSFGNASPDEKNMFLTPYTYIRTPEDYKNNVTCKVVSEDPYTVEFRAKENDTLLYSLVFDGKGDEYLGTLDTDLGKIDIYANVAAISESDENYKTFSGYQDELSYIVEYWKTECGLTQEKK